jgi:hypothetical protein
LSLSLSLSLSLCARAARSIDLLLTSGRLHLQEKHPSALAQFESLLAAIKGKQIVMFLDYDGTLSPIVEDPDRAVMSEEVSSNLRPVFFFFPMQRIPFFKVPLLSSPTMAAVAGHALFCFNPAVIII